MVQNDSEYWISNRKGSSESSLTCCDNFPTVLYHARTPRYLWTHLANAIFVLRTGNGKKIHVRALPGCSLSRCYAAYLSWQCGRGDYWHWRRTYCFGSKLASMPIEHVEAVRGFYDRIAKGCSRDQYGTGRYTTVPYTTPHYSTGQCSTVQHSTVWWCTVRTTYCTVQYTALHYTTFLYTPLHYTHTHTTTHIHTPPHTPLQKYTHHYTHTHIRTYIHTCTHAHMHTCIQTYMTWRDITVQYSTVHCIYIYVCI